MERCPCDLGEVTAYHDESLQSFEVEPRVQLTQKARYSTLQHIVNDPYSRHIKEIKHIHVSNLLRNNELILIGMLASISEYVTLFKKSKKTIFVICKLY